MHMRVAGLVFGIVVAASPAWASPENEMSEAGVRAVEAHWVRAFLGGDEAYLNTLLDADYVSINLKGVPRPKADIVALARKIAASTPSPGPLPEPKLGVSLHGAAAVVTDYEPDSVSVDVFHYDGGAWHAWYSQHTPVTPAAAK